MKRFKSQDVKNLAKERRLDLHKNKKSELAETCGILAVVSFILILFLSNIIQ